MGIIIKQSIKGTIWSYIGIGVGFITTSYFFPNYLTTEVIGLIGLLLSYTVILSNLSLLGLPGVTNRLFSYFRNPQNNHNGFLFIALLFQLAGTALFLAAFFLLKPFWVKSNIDGSPLFVQYMYLLIPMVISMMVFTFLDVFNKVLYNAVFGTFLQEFVQRVLIFGCIMLYVFKFVSLNEFIIIYAIAFTLKTAIIFLYLLSRKELNIRPNFQFLDKPMLNEIRSVALFTLVGGLGTMIVFNLDKIIINQLTGLSNTGVYTIAFYFGSLIAVPSRPLLKISGTLIADSWRNNDIENIRNIYYKSCLNQLIIGGFLFTGIWVNLDNILEILGEEYAQGRLVILLIGAGYLFDMATGVNAQIIGYSKHYRMSLLFISVLIVMVVALMFALVPIWGIKGAALAIAVSLLFNNLMRYVFLYRKFGFQPFNHKQIIVVLIFMLMYLIVIQVPQLNLVWDLIVRSSLVVFLTGITFYFFPVSEDIKLLRDTILKRINLLKK